MQLNYANFFRWYTGTAADDTNNIPRIGKVDGARCFMPHLVPGEVAGIFINSPLPFLDNDDLADLHLRVVGGADIGAILQKAPSGAGYRLYATFALPAIAKGAYQFEIYNSDTAVQKAVSNYFRVSDGAKTAIVRYRNSRSVDYFDYDDAPDFLNQLRLPLSLAAVEYGSGTDTVQNVASGRRRILNGNKDKSFQLTTYYFDDGAHEAMASLIEHDYIEINGRSYVKKAPYAPNVRINSNLSAGQAELYEQAYSSINKYGQLPVKYTSNKLMSIAKDPVTIDAYTANNLLIKSYTNLAYAKDLPNNGYVKINGTGSAEILYLDGNGGYVRNTQALPLTLLQSALFASDYFVAIGNYAGNPQPVAPATITIRVSEQAVPYVDSNAIAEIDGVDQPAINSTGEETYTVPAGINVRIKAFTEGNPEAVNPYLTMTAAGDFTDTKSVAAYPGAGILMPFVTKPGGNYLFVIEGYGN